MLVLAVIGILGIFLSDDPLSTVNREKSERIVNSYIESLASSASAAELNLFDKTVLKIGLFAGINISKINYPEASKLLSHYIYGDGSELELDASYFQTSDYLSSVIKEKGEGEHGPIALNQYEDWRLSLALNPYYLRVTSDKVRIYHPNISFEPVNSQNDVFTVVPIGKFKLRIYDKLVSSLNPTPFYVFSEWSVVVD